MLDAGLVGDLRNKLITRLVSELRSMAAGWRLDQVLGPRFSKRKKTKKKKEKERRGTGY